MTARQAAQMEIDYLKRTRDKMEKALRLVLALHETSEENQVPGYLVRLDPQALKQVREALGIKDECAVCGKNPCNCYSVALKE